MSLANKIAVALALVAIVISLIDIILVNRR